MSLELLLPIGSIMALNITLIGVLYVMARSMRSMVDTNVVLNGEVQDAVKSRHESEKQYESDRAGWKIVKDDLQGQLDGMNQKYTALEADFTLYRVNSEKVINQLGEQLVTAKREWTEEVSMLKASIIELTKALREARDQLKLNEALQQQWKLDMAEAKRHIAELQRDNLAKDHEIKALQSRVKDLESKLQESETKRAQLEAREKELLQQLAALETGEPTPEEHEETKDDGSE